MDAKTLASKLGLTPKTVLSRARSLGITGVQAKIEGREGRPATVFSADECDRIANFGKPEKQANGVTEDDEIDAASNGSIVLSERVLAPLIAQMQDLNQSLDTIEKAMGAAMANRLRQTGSRATGYMVAELSDWQPLAPQANMGTIAQLFGALQPPAITPNLAAGYCDNLPPATPRQDSLKSAS